MQWRGSWGFRALPHGWRSGSWLVRSERSGAPLGQLPPSLVFGRQSASQAEEARMHEPHERIAQNRWHQASQDGGNPKAQAEGHQIAALAPVRQECWRRDYERQRPTLRKREQVQGGERDGVV